jgi:hypothetical protein
MRKVDERTIVIVMCFWYAAQRSAVNICTRANDQSIERFNRIETDDGDGTSAAKWTTTMKERYRRYGYRHDNGMDDQDTGDMK